MKILAVFTGGTISCSESGVVLSPDKGNSFLLLKSRPDVCFDALMPYTILSENLGAEELELLYKTVSDNISKGYDGIIVAHGTDTVQYSATYLALRLGLCAVPVVLVSANYPLSDSRSNGYDNFSAAVDFIAAKQGRGVFVSYRNSGGSSEIHRGGELLPHAAYSDDLYSMNGNIYGTMDGSNFVKNADYVENCPETGCDSKPRGRVLYLKAHPNMFYPTLTDEIKSVLLEGYHSGTLNTDSAELKSFCKAAKDKNIPVYLTGCTDGFNYESKSLFDDLNIKVLPPMSPVTAYVKLWIN